MPNGTVATALGLPVVRVGVVETLPAKFDTNAGKVQRFTTNNHLGTSLEIWTRATNNTGVWQVWNRTYPAPLHTRALTASDDLTTLAAGFYRVPDGAVATALGLPVVKVGAYEVLPAFGTGAIHRFTTGAPGAEVWTRQRTTAAPDTWGAWQRILPVDLSGTATAAQGALAETALQPGDAGTSAPAPTRPSPTWLTTFQPGHGWTLPLGGTVTADTTDRLMGTQSVVLTDGALERTGLTLNLTGKMLALWVKIDALAAGHSLIVYAMTNTTANFRAWQVRGGGDASAWFRVGEWMLVTLPWESSSSNGGSVDQANITQLRVRTFTAGQVHLQSLGTVPEAPTWPSGVVSITFDDGYDDFLEAAVRSMTPRGRRGTAYIIPSLVGTAEFMTEQQVKALKHVHGWDIQTHGVDVYTTRTPEQLRSDGQPPRSGSPRGALVTASTCRMSAGRTTRRSWTSHVSSS